MRKTSLLAFTVLLISCLISPAMAGEMTLEGSIMCAKCKLKKADATECQDVLVVENGEGETAEYYIQKNSVAEEFGHTCSGVALAAVTGDVSEKDGKMWISPSKMERKG